MPPPFLAKLDRSFTGGQYVSGAGRIGVVAPAWAVFVDDDSTIPEEDRVSFDEGIAAYLRAQVIAAIEIPAEDVIDTFRRAARKKTKLVAVLGRNVQIDAGPHAKLIASVLPTSGAVLVEQVRIRLEHVGKKTTAAVVMRVRTHEAIVFIAPVKALKDAKLTVLISQTELGRQIAETEADFEELVNPG